MELKQIAPTRRYRIKPKRDFGAGAGFWLPNAGTVGTGNYGFVKSGFVVTDGFCNIMPGATWFRAISDATTAIRIYSECAAAGLDSDEFWKRLYAVNGAQ